MDVGSYETTAGLEDSRLEIQTGTLAEKQVNKPLKLFPQHK